MSWTSWLGLPPLSHETAIHVDFASALIAVVALVFSVWSFLNQKRISLATMRIERDNDLIAWVNTTIDTIVEFEFLLRDAARNLKPKQFLLERDVLLRKLSAAIDKGRLYFPEFMHDTIGADIKSPSLITTVATTGTPLLDHLVEMYQLVKNVSMTNPKTLQAARMPLMKKKRDFVRQAQSEVEPDRRLISKKRGRHP